MVGQRLKAIRKEKNLSQKALAKIISSSAGYISEIEKGKKMPGGDFFMTLKRTLNISIDWLLTGEGEPYLKKDGEKSPCEFQLPAPNMIEMQHMELVRNFNDKVRAKNADFDLLQIENLDRETFLEVVGYIKGVASKLKVSADQQIYLGPDRRVGERREEGAADKFSKEADRRCGLDRRKVAKSAR